VAHPHRSVQALLDAEGGDDAFLAIRRRARAVVAEAMALGWQGPPFDMRDLASLRGLDVTTSSGFRDDQDACVLPGRVLLNSRKHRVRQRYSIAHEVGHTLFPDYQDAVREAGQLWRRDGDDSEFERLCQAAGAEFLMPLEPFLSCADECGRGLAGTLFLAERFDASIEATARRVIETEDRAMAALFLRPQDVTTGEWLDPSEGEGHNPYTPLGVSLVCTNEGCRAFESVRRARPPRGGAADRAWKRVSLARGAVVIETNASESWEHAGVNGVWSSEAMTLPKSAAVPHEVLCLLRAAAE
jgi:hypothetical protein